MTFKLFGRKIGNKMIIDEGGIPSGGNLSDYIHGVITDRAQKEAEALRQRDLFTQANLERFILETAPVRGHLQQLAAPMIDLLDYFGARDLLEELQRSQTFKGGKLETVEPRSYHLVVSDPAEGSRVLSRTRLQEFLDFSYLTNYGLVLTAEHDAITNVIRYRRESYGGFVSGMRTSPNSTLKVADGSVSVSVMVTNEIKIVSAVLPKDSGYSLNYSFKRGYEKRPGVNYEFYERNFFQHGEEVTLGIGTYVLGSGTVREAQSPDALKILIGDNLTALRDQSKFSF